MSGTFGAFTWALFEEMQRRRDFFSDNEEITTLYFGGGTPSVLPAEVFAEIVNNLRNSFDLRRLEEFTIEVNPDDVRRGGKEFLRTYRSCGVKRISMGVQATQDVHLRWMNRRHNFSDATKAFAMLREASFDNISLDLIFGYRGLSNAQWSESIETLAALSPEHISAYQLSIDPESALAERGDEDAVLSQDECAEQYTILCNKLKEAGYEHYEISNFAKPGRRSRHNGNYWKRVTYLGLGPAAHSFDGKNRRIWNTANLKEYCNGYLPQEEILSESDIYNEKIMLGLRTCDGIPAKYLNKTPLSLMHSLVQTDGRYRIPEDKWFICDNIISELFV